MQQKVVEFNKEMQKNQQEYRAGDVVRIHRKIKEGSKERIQIFEGMVIALKGGQSSSQMMTVRKVSNGGYGVEIIVPVESPMIEKIDLVKRAKVRSSKLYYVRDKASKALRFKFIDGKEVVTETPEALSEEAVPEMSKEKEAAPAEDAPQEEVKVDAEAKTEDAPAEAPEEEKKA